MYFNIQGVGVETAKNIILAGPAAVTLYDDSPVAVADLGTNFFFSPDSVGKKRAEVCLEPLQRLNPYVNVTVVSGYVHCVMTLTFLQRTFF